MENVGIFYGRFGKKALKSKNRDPNINPSFTALYDLCTLLQCQQTLVSRGTAFQGFHQVFKIFQNNCHCLHRSCH
jgi:hypothetical protein